MFNPSISLYKNAYDNKGSDTTFNEIAEIIGSDDLSGQVMAVQNCSDKKKREKLKKALPGVTWSGRFSNRNAQGIVEHSGLICIDFDHLKDARELKQHIMEFVPFVRVAFVSPSGTGLKVVCQTDICQTTIDSPQLVATVQECHLRAFIGLASYFFKHYQLRADESGKDVSRLCFLSWDNSIMVNESAEAFDESEHRTEYISWFEKFKDEDTGETVEIERSAHIGESYELTSGEYFINPPKNKNSGNPKPAGTKKKAVSKQGKSDVSYNLSDLQAVKEFTDKKYTYGPGKRNQYLNIFAMNCKNKGIYQDEVVWFFSNEFPDYIEDHGDKQLKDVVKSVYGNSKIEFGKAQNRPGKTSAATKTQSKPTAPKNTPQPGAPEYNESIVFWYESTKKDKESGETKTEYKFDHDGLTFFLANNGFRKMRLGDKGFQFVRVSNGLIDAVEPDEINHFIMAYLHKDVQAGKDGTFYIDDIRDELCEVRRMYKRGVNSYTKTSIYSSLPELKPTFLRDTEKTAYLYFENGYIEVTAEGKTFHSYSDLKANIWAKQRKQFTVSLIDKAEIEKSDVYRFLNCAIVGSGSEDGKDEQRMLSMFTTIGYCIDSYKDPTNTKAPIFQDRKPNTGDEANGGSGKTLTAHMIGKMINTCVLDGKQFKFEAPYPYDTFRVDHKLIIYNDVNKRFPFEALFHKITEDFQFDRRYVDAIVIPHEDAPKHLIITNYSLMGSTSSYARRQQIIEFSDFFNDEHTPKDEFKRRFFHDWDTAEWNRFYNFMLHCVLLYKKHGLVAFPSQNVKLNRLLSEAGEETIDWLDELFIGEPGRAAIRPLENNDRAEMFQNFRDQVRRWSKLENSNKFTNWVKLWADMRGFYFSVKKSGSKYSWTFTPKEK